jgi:hypothetical protein
MPRGRNVVKITGAVDPVYSYYAGITVDYQRSRAYGNHRLDVNEAIPLMLPTPNSYSLRICSNNSTFVLLSIPASCSSAGCSGLRRVGQFTAS